MMETNIDLRSKFLEYFHEIEITGFRSERFYDDLKLMNHNTMAGWLEAAFMQGAAAMARNTLAALGDHAAAKEHMASHYNRVLGDLEE